MKSLTVAYLDSIRYMTTRVAILLSVAVVAGHLFFAAYTIRHFNTQTIQFIHQNLQDAATNSQLLWFQKTIESFLNIINNGSLLKLNISIESHGQEYARVVVPGWFNTLTYSSNANIILPSGEQLLVKFSYSLEQLIMSLILSMLLILVFSYMVIKRLAAKTTEIIIDHTSEIIEAIQQINLIAKNWPSFNFINNSRVEPKTAEVLNLFNSIKKFGEIIEVQNKLSMESARFKGQLELAKQVAHDIRSPLTALDVVMRTELGMSEEKRILARSAITRIKDIANDLLEKNRGPQFQGQASAQTQPLGQQQGLYANQLDQSANQQAANGAFAGGATQATGAGANDSHTHRAAVYGSQGPSATLLVSMLESLLSEKRLQYRSRLGVEIDYQAEVSAYGLFTNVDPIEFKRLISNLINNAVEALPKNKGKVTLSLTSVKNKIQIAITDNGKGIPAHILPTLGKSGVSYSKEGTDSGTGLGLYHAKKTIELFGGELQIESIEGNGTTIRINLPLAKSPNWFVEKLKLKSNSQIFIVDDDSSIHQIWQGRLESLQFKKYNIDILNFSNPIDLENWVKSHSIKSDSIFLVDYEFLGCTQNGLDIINTLSLARQSILITSRYEEPQILQRSQNMNVKLIPKGIAGLVPIEILVNETADAVLIDDDALMHATWKSAAINSGKNLKTFFNADEFLNECQNFTNGVPIYIDVSLADGVRGDELARKIYDMGFSNIYLSTGYEKSEFDELTFLKGVIGKTPPW